MYDNLIIRASAGTGKTYRLSRRYLRLAFAGERLDAILAATFSRKAAGEIQFRVLFNMAESAIDEKTRQGLASELGGVVPTEGEARALLCKTLENLHRMRVCTLDSFFNQKAQCFALELGLPIDWEIMADARDNALRQQAIGQLLAQQGQEAFQLVKLLSKGEIKRTVEEDVTKLVKDMYDLWTQTPEDAWDYLKPVDSNLNEGQLAERIEALSSYADDYDFGNQNINNRILKGIVEKMTKGEWEMLLGSDTAIKVWDAICGNEPEILVYGKPISGPPLELLKELVRYAASKVTWSWKYQLENTKKLLDLFGAIYQQEKRERGQLLFSDIPLLLTDPTFMARHLDPSFRMDGQIEHLLLDEFQDTSPIQWRVFEPLAREMTRPVEHRSFFCVGDVKQAIYGWRGGEAAIFDLLNRQLANLNEESMDLSYRSGPCIMDVTNDVFDYIAQNPALIVKDQAAADAWQNRFSIHKTAKIDYESYVEMTEVPWQEIDPDSIPDGADDDSSGSDSADDEKTPDAAALREMVFQYAADKIIELYNKTQDAQLTIGVLTRGKAAAGRMAQLIKERGIECSEEGKSALLDAAEVEQILALLHWIDHPGDTVALYQVCQSALVELVNPSGAPIFTGPEQKPVSYRQFLPALQSLRIQLMTDGYGPVVERCAQLLADQATGRNQRRLEILVEQAYEYDSSKTCRTDDFSAVIETLDVSDVTSSRIRIMNYHLSKGLQFDIVILPELDVLYNRMAMAKIIPGRKEPDQPPFAVLRYISEKLLAYVDDEIKTIFDQYRQKLTEESLCLLYVALTRAIHALYLFIQPPKTKKESGKGKTGKKPKADSDVGQDVKLPKTYAGILRGSLCPTRELVEKPEEAEIFYQIGDPDWYRKVGPAVGKAGAGAEDSDGPKRLAGSLGCAPGKAAMRPLESISATGWETTAAPKSFLKIRRFSCVQEDGELPLVLKKPDRDDSRTASGNAKKTLSPTNRGRLIHRWLEDIEFSDEYRFNPNRLVALGVALGLQPEEVEAYLDPFHRLLAGDSLQKQLRRPDGSWSVYRERIVAGILAQSATQTTGQQTGVVANAPDFRQYLVRGTIDRLELHRNEDGRVDRAAIIDYKTVPCQGVRKEADGAEISCGNLNPRMVKRFANQMDAYRRLIAQTYRLPLNVIETSILLIEY